MKIALFLVLLFLSTRSLAVGSIFFQFDPSEFFGVSLGAKIGDIIDVDELQATQTDGGVSYDVEGLKLLNAHSFWGFRINSLNVNPQTAEIQSIYARTVIYERKEQARRAANNVRAAIERRTRFDGSPILDKAFNPSDEIENVAYFILPQYNHLPVRAEVNLYTASSGYFATLNVYFYLPALEGYKKLPTMSGNYPGQNSAKKIIEGAFSEAKDKVVIIETSKGVGSGFIAKDCDKKYLFTNRHVMSGASYVSVKFLDGSRLLKLGDIEIAKDLDLIRFEVSSAQPALELDESIPNIGDRIVTFGNSGGRGVCTEIHGLINGVGPCAIETDAEFVTGNSGSPILGANYKVIAVATYLVDGRKTINWTNEGTRFSKTRRFGLRVAGAEWIKMSWNDFLKETEGE